MEQEDKRLARRLQEYGAGDTYPLHMPGHKRRAADIEPLLPWDMDITEIEGFDDLHDARDILREAQDRAARLYGSKRAWFLVNGSTCGLLAAITAAVPPGGELLVARNCHKAVYHAMELSGLRPHYLQPAIQYEVPFCGCIRPAHLAEMLEKFPASRAVVITSPTYEGILSDVKALADICHSRGIPLIVDEAHGAHLGLGGGFPDGAVKAGADLVIQSLHKTLPSLTQTALLHLNGERIGERAIDHELDIFETSSPSYLLMASMDSCLRWLEKDGPSALLRWRQQLDDFEKQCAGLRNLTLYTEKYLQQYQDFCPCKDPSKLVVGRGEGHMHGPELTERLRRLHRMEPEMTQADYFLAMTGALDDEEGYRRFAKALQDLDAASVPPDPEDVDVLLTPPLVVPPFVYPVDRALHSAAEVVPIAKSAGRISADYVWAYPPGIPWLVPGERITREIAFLMLVAEAKGIQLKKTHGLPKKWVTVLKEAPQNP